VSDLRTGTGPIQRLKEERARQLNAVQIPILRVIGSAFISAGVFLNNRYVLDLSSLVPWVTITIILAAYCAASWVILATWYGNVRLNLALAFLVVDVPIWTLALYFSGAEQSWMFFILFMRVADQTQSSFARCFAFTALGTLSYAAMIGWVVLVDHRALLTSAATIKLVFIFFGGVYISLTARASEKRRGNLANAVRMARELVRQLELQSAQLREARGRAEEASAAKSEFLANMSHEMRTPLHGILGMLQLLIESETLPDRVRQLEMARRSAESLLATIGDILDFSKIEARRLDLEPVYFSLRELVTDTVKALGVTAAEKNLPLAVAVAPEVPDRVWGDPLRLRQVIVNLVGNALKFTNAGEVVMRVTCTEIRQADATLAFEVRDTGIGIEPRMRAAIFTPFAQADTSHSRRYGGTGLGLAIASRIIDTMAGEMTVESEVGKGSVFRFAVTFPCEPGSTAPRPAWEARLAGLRVLVVEPQATSRGILAEILRAHRVQCDAYASLGDVGEGSLHQTYSCIVADAPIVGAMIPVVRIASPLTTATEVGVTVTRPVGERELLDAIGIALGLTERGLAFTLERRADAEGMLHVLVVDDHPVNQEFAIEALRRLGHRVTSASNGEEALRALARTRFDLVLLDVQMPGVDGLEVARRFRDSESGARTPIVALTAHTTREMRDRCLAAGFDSVLPKPVSQPALAAVLRGAEAPASPPPDEPDILSAVGGNMKLLARVREAFVEQTPRLMQGIRDAIAARDAKSIYEKAHTMKGAVSNFGVAGAVQAASEIERAGRESAIDRAAELLPLLEAKVRDLEERLEEALGARS